MNRHILACLLAVSGGLLASAPIQAGSALWVPPSSCTGINCASNTLNTNVVSSSSLSAFEPLVLQLMSTSSHCTRLDLTSMSGGTDLEITAIGPDGNVYRNDDRNGATDRRPLVVIPAGAATGWYTVQVSQYNGYVPTPGAHYDAALSYGRYTGTSNPNCANPTTPLFVPGVAAAK